MRRGAVMAHIWTINESGPTYERVMSHTEIYDMGRHLWIWVISHLRMHLLAYAHEAAMDHIWTSHVIHRRVWHVWMRHVMHTGASIHTYEWVMTHIYTSHVTYRRQRHGQALMNVSCHTHESICSHIRMSHGTHMHESCHTQACVTCAEICGLVMSCIWMRLFTRIDESWHTYERVMSLIGVCDMGRHL